MNDQRTPEEIAGVILKDAEDAGFLLPGMIAAAIRAERVVKEFLVVECDRLTKERDELKAEYTRLLHRQVPQPSKEPAVESEPAYETKVCPVCHGINEGTHDGSNPCVKCNDTGEVYVNHNEAREKSIHEVIQGCMTISCYDTISRFSDALIAERDARDRWKTLAEAGLEQSKLLLQERDRWKERAEKAESHSAELIEELRITQEQRDASVKKQAATQERYNFAKSMSKSVWQTHEAQFAGLEAERDQLKAALEGVVRYVDEGKKLLPICRQEHLYRLDTCPEMQAARDALKGLTTELAKKAEAEHAQGNPKCDQCGQEIFIPSTCEGCMEEERAACAAADLRDALKGPNAKT